MTRGTFCCSFYYTSWNLLFEPFIGLLCYSFIRKERGRLLLLAFGLGSWYMHITHQETQSTMQRLLIHTVKVIKLHFQHILGFIYFYLFWCVCVRVLVTSRVDLSLTRWLQIVICLLFCVQIIFSGMFLSVSFYIVVVEAFDL